MNRTIKRGIIAIVLFFIIMISLIFYFNRAGLMRWRKNLKSGASLGLNREIIIYNIEGEEILRYKAKMDFTYDSNNNMLEYIDADTGLKHNIFLGSTNTAVIHELE